MARVSAAPSGPSASRRRRYSSSVSAPPLSARASSPGRAPGFASGGGGAVAAASAAASSARCVARSRRGGVEVKPGRNVVFPAGAATGGPRAGGGADGRRAPPRYPRGERLGEGEMLPRDPSRVSPGAARGNHAGGR